MDKKSLNEIQGYLNKSRDFRYNIVSDRLEMSIIGKNEFVLINDYEENSIRRELIENDLEISSNDLHDLLWSDFSKKYDPLKEYFEGLAEWDSTTDYIDLLSKTVETTQQDYWKQCLRKWLIAAVASIIENDVVNHTVLIFCGAQGIGKSRWQDKLYPRSLKEYKYPGTINPKSKDLLIHLSECFLIILDELKNMNSRSIEDLKEIITKPSIRIRKPYGRNNDLLPRRASFIGSINDRQFLNDTTGNRRFICFSVNSINKEHEIDMGLVWAQAYALYKSGEKYWFDLEEIKIINENNEQYQSATSEEEMLVKYFEPCNGTGSTPMTSTDICTYINKKEKIFLNNVTMGKALSKQSYNKTMKHGISYWSIKHRQENALLPEYIIGQPIQPDTDEAPGLNISKLQASFVGGGGGDIFQFRSVESQ